MWGKLKNFGRVKFLVQGVFALLSILILNGCCPFPENPVDNPNPLPSVKPSAKGVIYYFISAPIDSVKAKDALSVLESIKKVGDTQLISSGNTYKIIEVCEKDYEYRVPDSRLRYDADTTVVDSAIASLIKVAEKEKNCSANFATTIPISTILIDAAQGSDKGKKEPIVILWQIPWSIDQASPESLAKLKEQINTLSQSETVKAVVIFGAHPKQTDKMASAFKSLQKISDSVRFYISTEVVQTLVDVKQVRDSLTK